MKKVIQTIVTWLSKPHMQYAFNGLMTLLWLVMLPITFIVPIFRTSVLWVAFISAWALFATHLGAWIAASVDMKAERIDDRTGEALKLSKIEETELDIIQTLNDGHAQILKVVNALYKEKDVNTKKIIDEVKDDES